jgi:hypothetical protein
MPDLEVPKPPSAGSDHRRSLVWMLCLAFALVVVGLLYRWVIPEPDPRPRDYKVLRVTPRGTLHCTLGSQSQDWMTGVCKGGGVDDGDTQFRISLGEITCLDSGYVPCGDVRNALAQGFACTRDLEVLDNTTNITISILGRWTRDHQVVSEGRSSPVSLASLDKRDRLARLPGMENDGRMGDMNALAELKSSIAKSGSISVLSKQKTALQVKTIATPNHGDASIVISGSVDVSISIDWSLDVQIVDAH